MVPIRQQSPRPGAQQKLVGRARVSAALPGVLALGDSRDRCGVQGCWWQERERSQDRASSARLVGLLPPPSLPRRPGSVPSPLSPGCRPSQERFCCPTQQRCVRTRRRTSLLLYTNRAGIGTQCCPRQEGGRQTEREGDIREVLRTDCDSTEENRLQQQQSGMRTAQPPTAALASKARHPAALPAMILPRGRGVPAASHTGSVSQKPAQMVPLPRPKAGAPFGGRHGRPLSHKLCHQAAAARRGERRGRTETKG